MIFTKDDTIWYQRSSSAGWYRVWWTMLMVINQIPVWQTVFQHESVKKEDSPEPSYHMEATDSKPTILFTEKKCTVDRIAIRIAIWMLVTWQCYPCISIHIHTNYIYIFNHVHISSWWYSCTFFVVFSHSMAAMANNESRRFAPSLRELATESEEWAEQVRATRRCHPGTGWWTGGGWS